MLCSVDEFIRKRILVIITGGTIAGHVARSDSSEQTLSDASNFEAILGDSVDIVKQNWGIEIQPDVKELFSLDSSNVLPVHWTAIIDTIQEQYDHYDSFIVLHGTNTMGYTCAALSFALENINKPVIVTGAQVPLGYMGSDATTNLVNALRLSIWVYHSVKGVMAVFGSKVISGVRVKKGTDFDYDPFKSFIRGSLGEIGRYIRIDAPALDRYTSYLSRIQPLAQRAQDLSVKKDFDTSAIASLTEFPGMSPEIIKSLVEHNSIRALIFRAFGAGDVSANLFESFQYLKEKQIPVIVTTQAPNGVASFQVNETGAYLRQNELAIPAFDMSIESITVKMSWLLAQNFNYEQIKTKMTEDMHGEIIVENEPH